MRAVPELITITTGMLMASRALLGAVIMILLLSYTFAILMHMLVHDDGDLNDKLEVWNFKSVPASMWTLFVSGAFMEDFGYVATSLLNTGTRKGIAACMVFMTFVMITAFTVLNMLIGVLCEVVSTVGKNSKDHAAVALVKEYILMELKRFDNGDGRISKMELDMVMRAPHARAVLDHLKVDRLFLTELQGLLYTGNGEVYQLKTLSA